MAILKSLSFTTLPQPGANPTFDRRLRLIGRLEEQKRLVADPNYKRTIQTSVKKDGVKTYLSYNMEPVERKVTFSDGASIDVPGQGFGIRVVKKP